METESAEGWVRRKAEISSLRIAAENPAAMAARRNHCQILAENFRRFGEWLRCFGNIIGPQRVDGTSPFGNGNDGAVALGYVSETAACMIHGATGLVAEHNPYAAAALVRQLVEIEYLTWAFAEDQEDASSWLRSSRTDRLQRWQPRHLRKRSQGRFRGFDYAEHCNLGGHPTPEGVRTLVADTAPIRNGELIVSEAAHHGSSAWHYAYSAHTIVGAGSDLFGSELNEVVADSERSWHQQDQLASTWLAIKAQGH